MPSLYFKNGNSNRGAAKGKVPFLATTTEAEFQITEWRVLKLARTHLAYLGTLRQGQRKAKRSHAIPTLR